MGATNSSTCVAGQRGQTTVAQNRKHDAERARYRVFPGKCWCFSLNSAVKYHISYAMLKMQVEIAKDGNNDGNGYCCYHPWDE